MKLSDGSVELELLATNFEMNMEADFSPVRGQGSNWFSVKSPNMGAIQITFMQGSIYAQEAAAGLCQKWAKENQPLYFTYEEMGINEWIVFIKGAPFTFQYDKPVNPCQITLSSVTNWYYSEQAALPQESDIYSIFSGGIVTKGVTALEDANQVAEWIESHEQFRGVQVQYLSNGNVSIKYSNGQTINNVKPTYQLLQSLVQYSASHQALAQGGFGKAQNNGGKSLQNALHQLEGNTGESPAEKRYKVKWEDLR